MTTDDLRAVEFLLELRDLVKRELVEITARHDGVDGFAPAGTHDTVRVVVDGHAQLEPTE